MMILHLRHPARENKHRHPDDKFTTPSTSSCSSMHSAVCFTEIRSVLEKGLPCGWKKVALDCVRALCGAYPTSYRDSKGFDPIPPSRKTPYSVDLYLRLELVINQPGTGRSEIDVNLCLRSGLSDRCVPQQGFLSRWLTLPFMPNFPEEKNVKNMAVT